MVRCGDCGFLVVRSATDERELVSPGAEQRQTGIAPEVDEGPEVVSAASMAHLRKFERPLFETKPWCSLGANPIDQEYEAEKPERSPQWSTEAIEAAKVTMGKSRECTKFTPWIPALSPKEHMEMLATQQMFEAQAARLDVQAAREREWRKEDMKLAADTLRAARGNTLGVWVGVVAALLMSLASFLWTVCR